MDNNLEYTFLANKRCPLCGLSISIAESTDFLDRKFRFDCPNCGTYQALGDDMEGRDSISEKTPLQRAIVCHAVAKHKVSNKKFCFDLTTERLEESLKTTSLPRVAQKIDNFVYLLGKHSTKLGHSFPHDFDYATIQGEVGAIDRQEVLAIADSARELGVVLGGVEKTYRSKFGRTPTCSSFELSLQGWERYEQICEGEGEGNEAFMAMPFGNEELDKVFRDFWKPAAEKVKYRLERVDERPSAGLIDDHIRSRIRKAKFMLCDLTGGNQGAYWEAGFAEGVGVPVIYVFKEEKEGENHKPHFDVNHHLYIKWNETNLAEQAKLLTDVITETMVRRGK